jgi:hypothetical protein
MSERWDVDREDRDNQFLYLYDEDDTPLEVYAHRDNVCALPSHTYKYIKVGRHSVRSRDRIASTTRGRTHYDNTTTPIPNLVLTTVTSEACVVACSSVSHCYDPTDHWRHTLLITAINYVVTGKGSAASLHVDVTISNVHSLPSLIFIHVLLSFFGSFCLLIFD